MTENPNSQSMEVPLSSLIDLGIEAWRLNRWLQGSESDRTRSAARLVARRLDAFLGQHGIAVQDVTGRPYDPGLALEIEETISDPYAPEGSLVIEQVVTPIVLWRDAVVRHARVVIRKGTGTP